MIKISTLKILKIYGQGSNINSENSMAHRIVNYFQAIYLNSLGDNKTNQKIILEES